MELESTSKDIGGGHFFLELFVAWKDASPTLDLGSDLVQGLPGCDSLGMEPA